MTSSDKEREILAIIDQKRRAFEEEERSLRDQLIAEQKRKREEEERERATRPLVITAYQFHNGMVMTRSEYRTDLLDVWKSFKTRYYRGGAENSLAAHEWRAFVIQASALPNITIEYEKGIEKAIDKWLDSPDWEIEAHQRWLHVIPGPRAHRNLLWNAIPGIEWNHEGEFYKVPLSEALTLAEKLNEVENVVWDPLAQQLWEDQLMRKSRLDAIAVKERDEEYAALDLNGERLRDFQTVGCAFGEATGIKFICADEMGLGKSPQAIAIAVKNKFERIIIVCPAFLKPNWKKQIKKFTGEDAAYLRGRTPTQLDMARMVFMTPKWTIINYDILGTKGEDEAEKTRFLWAELINAAKPDLIIIDEAHYGKNIDSNRSQAMRWLKAPHMIFLTGTPVMNRPGELWPMLTMIDPAGFPSNDTFLRQYTIDGKRVRNTLEMKTLLKPLMIRRLKSELSEYQGITLDRITEYTELSERADKLYAKIEMGIYERIAEYDAKGRGGDNVGITSILAQIMRLKQVCAIDKTERTADLARDLYDQSEGQWRKVLIFSQFKPIAYRISQMLADDGCLSFVTRGVNDFITASIERRYELVKQFQEDENIKYMVVTEKSAREGLDITKAGHVIFNDLFWTPASHEQCEGRAYGRMSDMHGIDSRYLVVERGGDGIEEWIMQLLALKTGVIKQSVDGINEVRSSDESIVNAIIQMFREKQWTRKK